MHMCGLEGLMVRAHTLSHLFPKCPESAAISSESTEQAVHGTPSPTETTSTRTEKLA